MLKQKSKLLIVLSLLMACCLFVGMVNMFTVKAEGEENIVETTEIGDIIYEGASIRFGSNAGIRFSTIVDKDKYDKLSKFYNIEVHTLIVPTELLNGATLTRENAEEKEAVDIFIGSHVEKTLKINGLDTDFYSFNAVIYDIDAKFYSTMLTAKTYVKFTEKTNTSNVDYKEANKKIVITDDGNVLENAETIERSAVYVAQKVKYSDFPLTEANRNELNQYISACANLEAKYTVEYYLDGVLDATKTEVKSAKIDTEVKVEEANDIEGYYFNSSSNENVLSGIVMVDGSTVLKVYYNKATVLYTAEDFYNFANKFVDLSADINDYVMLGADIDMKDLSSYTLGNITISEGVGFAGTFDGKGHSITGLTVANKRGLFGRVQENAIIKNVSFVDAVVSGSSSLFATWFGGTLDNVFVDVTLRRADYLGTVAAICLVPAAGNKYITIRNSVIVSRFDKMLDGSDETASGGSSGKCYAVSRDYNEHISFENVYAVTDLTYLLGAETKDSLSSSITVYSLNQVLGETILSKGAVDGCSISINSLFESIPNGYKLSKIIYNQKEIGKVENDVWTVSNSEIKELQVGNNLQFTAQFKKEGLNDANLTFDINVLVADVLLNTATDVYNYFSKFINITADINDYVMLGADIDMSKGEVDYTSLTNGKPTHALGNSTISDGLGFTGTFDGNGHTITGLRVGNSRGLFGRVESTATIKNVSFTDAIVCGSSSFFATWFGGTLDNVYLETILRRENYTKSIAPICAVPADTAYMKIKNSVIVSKFDKMLDGSEETAQGGSSGKCYAVSRDYNEHISFENVYVVTDLTYLLATETEVDNVTKYTFQDIENGAKFDYLDKTVWDTTGKYPTLK